MPLSTQDLEHFLNQARIELTGASDAGIKEALYETVKEWLADTNSWVEHFHLPVQVGKQSYILTPRNGGQVLRLYGVWDGNRLPVPSFMQEFGTVEIHWPINANSIVPPPGTPPSLGPANPYLVVVTKNVQLPTTREHIPVIPDFVLRVYSIGILDGMLGRMMQQPNKSYSDKGMAEYHLKRFRAAMVEARVAAAAKNTVGGQSWAFPRGWRSNTQRGGMVSAWPPETF